MTGHDAHERVDNEITGEGEKTDKNDDKNDDGARNAPRCVFFSLFLILLTIIYKDYAYDTTTAAPRPPTPSSLYFTTAT
jgi:hypothetical protein